MTHLFDKITIRVFFYTTLVALTSFRCIYGSSDGVNQSSKICSDHLTTLDAGLADAQESPCFVNFFNSDTENYHKITCVTASIEQLRLSLHDYARLNCTQLVVLQIVEFDHPLDADLFEGLQERLRVLIIQQWNPTMPYGNDDDLIVGTKLRGSPFIQLEHLDVLDVSLDDIADSALLTKNFFIGLSNLRVLQTGNIAASLLVSVDIPETFPLLECAGFHESLHRNCTCQEAKEMAKLSDWTNGLKKPGWKWVPSVTDSVMKTITHPCKIEIYCFLKDATRNLHDRVLFSRAVYQKVCSGSNGTTTTTTELSTTNAPSLTRSAATYTSESFKKTSQETTWAAELRRNPDPYVTSYPVGIITEPGQIQSEKFQSSSETTLNSHSLLVTLSCIVLSLRFCFILGN